MVSCQTIYSLSNDLEHFIDIFKDCVTVRHSVPVTQAARFTLRRRHHNDTDTDAAADIITTLSSYTCHKQHTQMKNGCTLQCCLGSLWHFMRNATWGH